MSESRVLENPNGPGNRAGSRLQFWLTAGRVWALPASAMPVLFGTILAVTIGGASFDLGLFAAALAAMSLLHTGSNLVNDVYDYRNGLDRQVHPASGAVVRGWITPGQGMWAAAICLAAGSLIGFYIVSQVGISILLLGAVGVLCGVLYTWGPWPLKYHAFGDLAVFLNFGVLGALGAWTVQTGRLSWVPAVWAVPMSILVIAILHSNNWRDISQDANRQVRTVARCLGDAGSQAYQKVLLFAPFAIIAFLVLLTHVTALSPRMPATFLITLLAVPLAVRLVRTGAGRHDPQNALAFAAMDGATAQLNLVFGLLCIAALGLDVLIR
jgi:1,4-dihydroxy-2-naphthoate octaprenyltransferase